LGVEWASGSFQILEKGIASYYTTKTLLPAIANIANSHVRLAFTQVTPQVHNSEFRKCGLKFSE
jgi:hypothetical protein